MKNKKRKKNIRRRESPAGFHKLKANIIGWFDSLRLGRPEGNKYTVTRTITGR